MHSGVFERVADATQQIASASTKLNLSAVGSFRPQVDGEGFDPSQPSLVIIGGEGSTLADLYRLHMADSGKGMAGELLRVLYITFGQVDIYRRMLAGQNAGGLEQIDWVVGQTDLGRPILPSNAPTLVPPDVPRVASLPAVPGDQTCLLQGPAQATGPYSLVEGFHALIEGTIDDYVAIAGDETDGYSDELLGTLARIAQESARRVHVGTCSQVRHHLLSNRAADLALDRIKHSSGHRIIDANEIAASNVHLQLCRSVAIDYYIDYPTRVIWSGQGQLKSLVHDSRNVLNNHQLTDELLRAYGWSRGSTTPPDVPDWSDGAEAAISGIHDVLGYWLELHHDRWLLALQQESPATDGAES